MLAGKKSPSPTLTPFRNLLILDMAASLRSFLLLLATLSGTAALAQTPTLEFASGANNPTANGPHGGQPADYLPKQHYQP